MLQAGDLQEFCERICNKLAHNRFDPEAFELLHSSEFLVLCAWLNLDPEVAFGKLTMIAEQRRKGLENRGNDGTMETAAAQTA